LGKLSASLAGTSLHGGMSKAGLCISTGRLHHTPNAPGVDALMGAKKRAKPTRRLFSMEAGSIEEIRYRLRAARLWRAWSQPVAGA
jgi:hypothetical protein